MTVSEISPSENTKFSGPIYADPSVKIYHALGMDVENLKATPANQERRSYLTIGGLSNALMSIWVRSSPQHVAEGLIDNICSVGLSRTPALSESKEISPNWEAISSLGLVRCSNSRVKVSILMFFL
jgi:hypothetical protein